MEKSKLAIIQNKLVAPKGQYNAFGKYAYRSCEDILQAVKPLLDEVGAHLIFTDTVELIGDRYYIRASVEFCAGEESHTTSALAREPEHKKGMDESQITGAASSYARKYALNGLFAIDDTKDADATNAHGKVEPAKKVSQAPKQPAKIDIQQSGEYMKAITDAFRHASSIEELDSVKHDIGTMYQQMTTEHQDQVKDEYVNCKDAFSQE